MSTTRRHDFVFSPDSTIWHINRERVLLLGGGRVLLMQLAHPLVAEAVYEHSYVFRNPFKRLHRTLSLTLTMVFGTRAEVQDAVAEIERAHRPAVGQLSQATGAHAAGTSYNARNPRQGLWVYATLVEGALFSYDKLVAPLDDATKEAFYADSLHFADWMGIPSSYLPATYSDLLDYMQTAIAKEEIHVSDHAREIAPFITMQSIPLLNMVSYPVYRMSAYWLPEPLRTQFGYTVRDWEPALIDRATALSRRVVSHLPGRVRFVPEYRRAMRRL